MLACSRGYARIPLGKGHLKFARGEGLADRHLVAWEFIRFASFERSHDEAARWDDDHLGTFGAILEHFIGLHAAALVPNQPFDTVTGSWYRGSD